MHSETLVCWSCKHESLTEEVRATDGYCPACDAPIDFDEDEDDD
nr:hypothetical protein [Pantoea sp. 201603H]